MIYFLSSLSLLEHLFLRLYSIKYTQQYLRVPYELTVPYLKPQFYMNTNTQVRYHGHTHK